MTLFPRPARTLAALFAALQGALLALAATAALAQAEDVQEASRLLKAGQTQQALERVNKALAARPKDAQARFLKGLIFAEQGNAKDAIDVFQQLTRDYPDLPEPYNNLAVVYASQGQYEKARSALEQSIRTHPSYATAYENLGDVYAKLASQAYDKALQIDSANAGAKNKLALVRELVGGSTQAVAAAKPPAVVASAPVAAPAPAPVPSPAPKESPPPAKTPAVVATAEPRPVAAPAPAKASGADVLDTVRDWAKAWSSKNVEAYLAHYARDFKTPGGEPRPDWEKSRRQRINAPKSISVTVDGPKVSIGPDGLATVTFRQGYRSDVLKGTSTMKTLVLAQSDGKWLIQQERVGH